MDCARRITLFALGIILAFALVWSPSPSQAQTGRAAPEGQIVRLISVGTVLTADGAIWAYRPDLEKWMTIDESFREEGRQTHILPLPVRPDEIREMVTFGFLLTESGACWLYDIEKDRWLRLPEPGKR